MPQRPSVLATLLVAASVVHSQTPTSAAKPENLSFSVSLPSTSFVLQTPEEFMAKIGQPFPEFEFTDLNGKVWKSEKLRGKVVYLNFWFTGCPPCVKEIPSLNNAYSYFHKNPNVVMLSINGFESKDVIKKFIIKSRINLPISTIIMKELMLLAGNNGNIAFPTHLIIDQDWKLAIAFTGGNQNIGDSIKKDIESILKSKSAFALQIKDSPQPK